MKCFVGNYRKSRGLAQRDLAARVGLDTSQISRIERVVNRPSVDTALKIAAALDCAVGQLWQLEDSDLAKQLELLIN